METRLAGQLRLQLGCHVAVCVQLLPTSVLWLCAMCLLVVGGGGLFRAVAERQMLT